MSQSDTEHNSASGAVDSTITNTRLTGPWLMIARTVWLVLVVPSVVLFVVSLFVTYQQLQSGAIPAQEQQVLSAVGLSVSGFNTLNTILNVLTSAIWYMVGFLIFWRRSDDWLALLAAFVLVMFNVGPWSNNNTSSVLALAYPALTLPLSLISFLWDSSLGVFLLLFPGGRLVPRWMGLILLLYLIQAFLGNFPSPLFTFRCKLASVARTANCSRHLWSHYLFANLSLPARIHACPAPADKVGNPRNNSGNRNYFRHFNHNFSYPIQQHLTVRCIYCYCHHLARCLAPDPALHRFLDFALSALRHRSTN